MFLLPNHKKIDEDGVIDAMLDTDMSRRYFLDTMNGEVGCVEQKAKNKPVLDPKRYIEVPRITVGAQLSWLKESTQMIEDRDVVEKVMAEMQKGSTDALLSCEKILSESESVWIYGWKEWQGQSGFEEMLEWFSTLPIDIEDKFEGCGDCEMCKLMEQGEHNLGDFLEAKQKEERKADEKKNK